jgi:hypothetical protein
MALLLVTKGVLPDHRRIATVTLLVGSYRQLLRGVAE